MNSAVFAVLIASAFVTVTVSQAASDVPQSGTRRATYLGFPRLGRGYLALPRMGRSQAAGSDAEAGNGGACCTMGLKKEWVYSEGGKMSEQSVCEAEVCCPDLLEVQRSRPDGAFYTMCVPKCGDWDNRNLDLGSDNVMLKLRRLFRN